MRTAIKKRDYEDENRDENFNDGDVVILVLTEESFVQTEPAVHQTEDNLALSGCEAVSYFRQSVSACNFELDKSIVCTNTSFRTW